MTDDIRIGRQFEGMTVAEAATPPDARILPAVGEPAADESHTLDEF